MVGDRLLTRLVEKKHPIVAFSRNFDAEHHLQGVAWRQLSEKPAHEDFCIPYWICTAPIWVLPDYFNILVSYGAKRIVVLSSTSRYTKENSEDEKERLVAARLRHAELQVQRWAESNGIEWIILRPTLIYDLGSDKNITEIARFIRRFGFFMLFGKAQGLRQPIHAMDVALACQAALHVTTAVNKGYNISGGETLTYKDMVVRVFHAINKKPRFLHIPLWMFKFAVTIVTRMQRDKNWSTSMAVRMNTDLVFEHLEAQHDFDFKPRSFSLPNSELINTRR